MVGDYAFAMSSEAEIRATWRRIEAWLSAHVPTLAETLNPPATARQIADAEAIIGAEFPPELLASLAVHDGQRPDELEVFGEWALLCVAESARVWRKLARMADEGALHTHDEPAWVKVIGAVRPRSWDRASIPIASDGQGDHLILDLDPPRGGTRGQVVTYGPRRSSREVVAPDFGAWLAQIAARLENGEIVVAEDGTSLVPRE